MNEELEAKLDVARKRARNLVASGYGRPYTELADSIDDIGDYCKRKFEDLWHEVNVARSQLDGLRRRVGMPEDLENVIRRVSQLEAAVNRTTKHKRNP